jgi:glycosyltransferase involved in cell wall biosynthesis
MSLKFLTMNLIGLLVLLVIYVIYHRIAVAYTPNRIRDEMFSGMQKQSGGPSGKPLRILFATEYLPPYISGIANRCKNWINGYRSRGHTVTVFSIAGSECDYVVPSITNPFYNRQRTFILPPLGLFLDLINPFKSVNYDIAHIVAPTCFSFLPLLPFMWLRGIKIYVSYHVYLEYYAPLYLGNKSTLLSRLFHSLAYGVFALCYYLPLTAFAECVGIPSRTADTYVFDFSKRIHVLKSGLDVNVFHPEISLRKSSPNSDVGLIKSSVGETDYAISNLREIAGEGSEKGPLLIYCGRLAKEKNVSFLINALRLEQLKDATLIIVGDGPLRPELEALASQIVGAEKVYSSSLDVS